MSILCIVALKYYRKIESAYYKLCIGVTHTNEKHLIHLLLQAGTFSHHNHRNTPYETVMQHC